MRRIVCSKRANRISKIAREGSIDDRKSKGRKRLSLSFTRVNE